MVGNRTPCGSPWQRGLKSKQKSNARLSLTSTATARSCNRHSLAAVRRIVRRDLRTNTAGKNDCVTLLLSARLLIRMVRGGIWHPPSAIRSYFHILDLLSSPIESQWRLSMDLFWFRRPTSLKPGNATTKNRQRRLGRCERLEPRQLLVVPAGGLDLTLDADLDLFGFQPVGFQVVQYENAGGQEFEQVAFSIVDTGASVVSLSVLDQFFFDFNGAGVPIKVAGGAEAEGIGGVLTGDVSQPVTVKVTGMQAASLTTDTDGFPVFDVNLESPGLTTAVVDDVQLFVGTQFGSPDLPTISGTPVLNPSAANPNGMALSIEPEGSFLDFSDLAEGLIIPIPNINFHPAGYDPVQTEATSDSGTVLNNTAANQFDGDAALLDLDDIYAGFSLRITSGALTGEIRKIADYIGATRTIVLESGLSAAPAVGDAFEIVRFSSDAITIPLEFIGFDNHQDPGNQMTFSPNPVQDQVTLTNNGVTLADQLFLADSGAMLSTITTQQAIDLQIDLNDPITTIAVGGAGGLAEDVKGYVIESLSVPTDDGGNLTFNNVPVFVIDVTEEFPNLGIMGMNLFNTASEFVYDPFDPDGPALKATFFTERIPDQPIDIDAETQALLEVLSPAFAGSLGVGELGVPQFQIADHRDRIGAFRQPNFFFGDGNNSGGWDASDWRSRFGIDGDRPIVGDWNDDGFDEIGVHRGNVFYLDTSGDGAWGAGDMAYRFGNPGDTPIVGDWDGSGTDEIGVYRDNVFFLDASGDGAWGADDMAYRFGNPGDTPIIGDWDGDGTDNIGVHRGRTFYLDSSANGAWGADDTSYRFGIVGDMPIVGDWDGSGTDSIGVHRGRDFFLDKNSDGAWDGDDTRHRFGIATDTPLIGEWRQQQQFDLNMILPSYAKLLAARAASPIVDSPAVESSNPLPTISADDLTGARATDFADFENEAPAVGNGWFAETTPISAAPDASDLVAFTHDGSDLVSPADKPDDWLADLNDSLTTDGELAESSTEADRN